MSNVKSLDALDINGLAIFKENIVKKYLTQGEAPSIIAQAVYKALQSYKKDVVQFYSSYANLPTEGNQGTLYLVPSGVNNEQDQIPSLIPDDEIWIYSASNEEELACRLNRSSSYTVDAKKHDVYPFHVLKLADIDPSQVTCFAPYQRSENNRGYNYYLYLPDTTTDISKYDQLASLAGKIIAVPLHNDRETTILPQLAYTGTLPDKWNVPSDEIWVLCNQDSLTVSVFDWGNNIAADKNQYGYFVLKKGVHFPSVYTSRIYPVYIGNSDIIYYNAKEKRKAVSLYDTNDLENLYGHIVTRSFVNDNRPLWVVYSYQIAEYTAGNKFVVYTYKNGKYIQISSSIFDTSDLHLEEITDQVLSLTSTNAISNKAFCDALRYKYSIANILATPAEGYDNIVSSTGIKSAIDKLVTWEDIDCIPITEEEIHDLFTTYKPITLEQANYYRIVIRGKKSDGAYYLTKIFDTETLTGLTFMSRSEDGPSMSEKLSFVEDDTGRYIPVTITCANKYNSPSQFWPGNLFDDSSDGYYRADTSDDDMVLTIDIKRKLSMSTLRKLTFSCLAGRPYQNTIPPVEKLYVSVYGSIGGVDYPTFRENVIYTPDKVANDGVYTIDIFPNT